MQKIPTLFMRDPVDRAHVTSEVNPVCQWVISGEGVPTRKYDGTCVMFDGQQWWARREVKNGKAAPLHFRPVTTDLVTGNMMGWEPIEQSAFAKYHAEALEYSNSLGLEVLGWDAGTYELIGPKINGNPEQYPQHTLISHEYAEILDNAPRSFVDLRDWLRLLPYEGVVWHHPNGRMAKLKRRDFT